MFLIIGLVVFGSIIGGCLVHHGQTAVLFQVNEFIIAGRASARASSATRGRW